MIQGNPNNPRMSLPHMIQNRPNLMQNAQQQVNPNMQNIIGQQQQQQQQQNQAPPPPYPEPPPPYPGQQAQNQVRSFIHKLNNSFTYDYYFPLLFWCEFFFDEKNFFITDQKN